MNNSFSMNWNVDYYKNNYEPEEHWEMRRNFMLAYKHMYPEEEVVSLAQVFLNVEILGCKYPEKTMEKISMLSNDITTEYRRKSAKKLKRIFIAASKAASGKVKARRFTPPEPSTSKEPPDLKKPMLFVSVGLDERSRDSETINSLNNQNPAGVRSGYIFTPNDRKNKNNNRSQVNQTIHHNIYGNLIIYQTHSRLDAFTKLLSSCSQQKISLKIVGDRKGAISTCTIKVNDVDVCVGTGDSKKLAKRDAGVKAIETLEKYCYTILPREGAISEFKLVNANRNDNASNINKTNCNSIESSITPNNDNRNTNAGSSNSKKPNTNYEKLSEENKGFKMMKMLGWSGGSLGIRGGIEEPISLQLKVDRKGLGSHKKDAKNYQNSDFRINKSYFYNYLKEYVNDPNAKYDLMFSSEFAKDERAELHKLAGQFQLKSQSKNLHNGERQLTISKKISLADLLIDIINNGYYSQIFEIKPPKP